MNHTSKLLTFDTALYMGINAYQVMLFVVNSGHFSSLVSSESANVNAYLQYVLY